MIAGRIIETRSSLGASWRRDHRDAIIETGVVWARSGMADGGVPGIEDLSRLGRWLDENGVARDQERPPRAALIAGGRSNLTYLLDAGLPPGSAGEAPPGPPPPPAGPVVAACHDTAQGVPRVHAL